MKINSGMLKNRIYIFSQTTTYLQKMQDSTRSSGLRLNSDKGQICPKGTLYDQLASCPETAVLTNYISLVCLVFTWETRKSCMSTQQNRFFTCVVEAKAFGLSCGVLQIPYYSGSCTINIIHLHTHIVYILCIL